MSKASRKVKHPKGRTTVTDKLDQQLVKREKLASKIAKAEARRQAGYAKVDRRYDKEVGKAPLKLARLDEGLASFLRRHRYWLTRLHAKTIERASGVVKFITRPRELELPENTEALIQDLLAFRGGKSVLIVSYRIDRKKALAAPAGIWEIFRRHGAWRGKHRTISVASPSKAITRISSERFNERS